VSLPIGFGVPAAGPLIIPLRIGEARPVAGVIHSSPQRRGSRAFLMEMPGSAPPYKRERDSNANGRHPR